MQTWLVRSSMHPSSALNLFVSSRSTGVKVSKPQICPTMKWYRSFSEIKLSTSLTYSIWAKTCRSSQRTRRIFGPTVLAMSPTSLSMTTCLANSRGHSLHPTALLLCMVFTSRLRLTTSWLSTWFQGRIAAAPVAASSSEASTETEMPLTFAKQSISLS